MTQLLTSLPEPRSDAKRFLNNMTNNEWLAIIKITNTDNNTPAVQIWVEGNGIEPVYHGLTLTQDAVLSEGFDLQTIGLMKIEELVPVAEQKLVAQKQLTDLQNLFSKPV